jgi:hypothetical protein
METRRHTIAWLTGAVLLAACSGVDDDAAPEPESADELSCPEVIASLEEANRIRAETFGGGPEGREATATIVQTVQQRPDCFSDEEVEFAAEWAETLPSDSETDAIEAAEAACDEPGGEFSTSRPGDGVYDSPEEALDDDLVQGMEGAAERSFEGDGRVEFEFRDEAEVFQGWVMVEQDDTGWFVRRGITCGADAGE